MDSNQSIFKYCTKCHIFRKNLKDLVKHLVEYHPIPKIWMSDKIDENCSKPYTIATDSRKKRRINVTPRPLNSFMIFSRHLRRVVLLFFTDASNSEISKLLGIYWSSLPVDTKSLYDSEAKRLAILHSKEFPNYKYQPQKRKKIMSVNINNIQDNDISIEWNADKNVTLEKSEINSDVFSVKKLDRHCIFSQIPLTGESNTPVYTISKRRNVMISNLTVEDFNDTESSASSSRLQNKTDLFQAISPMSDQFAESISERNPLHSASRIIKYTNYSNLIKSIPRFGSRVKLHSTLVDNCDFKELYIKTENVNYNSNLPCIQPLSIITDSYDLKSYSISSTKNKKTRCQTDFINDERTAHVNTQEFCKASTAVTFNATNNHLKPLNFDNGRYVPAAKVLPKLEHVSQHVFSTQPDPFITDHMSESNNFVNECLNIDTEYCNSSSQWLLQSPNYKFSSACSDNNYREIYGSPSPFLLSENDQNSIHIQKLPAIGSWLRSNNSEYTL